MQPNKRLDLNKKMKNSNSIECNEAFSSACINAPLLSAPNELSFSICRILSQKSYCKQPARRQSNLFVDETVSTCGNKTDKEGNILQSKRIIRYRDARIKLLSGFNVSDVHMLLSHKGNMYSNISQLDTISCLRQSCSLSVNPNIFSFIGLKNPTIRNRLNANLLARQFTLIQESKRQPGTE